MQASVHNYQRIQQAIAYLSEHHRRQPSLNEVAEKLNLSPFHFQRLFTEWAGVSPKQFVRYLSVEYAKRVLHNSQATLFDAAYQAGLSGTGRLHDLFVSIEGMTPGEYSRGGKLLQIDYDTYTTPFGDVFVASTQRGICSMAFTDNEMSSLDELRMTFPAATFQHKQNHFHNTALAIFKKDWSHLPNIKLHLKATQFQIKVWRCLLSIPEGCLSSYGKIAAQTGSPAASRAVGTAVGSNPVAFIIPCHRVVRGSGVYGDYRWGSLRKKALIAWEAAALDSIKE